MTMIHRIPCGIVNCYLLTGETGSILVDACNPGMGDGIRKAIGNAEVKLIVLTHGHSDHIGSTAYLRDQMHAPIAMSGMDVELIANPRMRKLYGHTPLGCILARASETAMADAGTSKFEPDILLSDGDDLSHYGVQASIITLPGHTAGSIGVLTNEHELVAGDAAFHMLRPTGARIYEDRAAMEQSISKMRQRGVERLYVGHGSPFRMSAI